MTTPLDISRPCETVIGGYPALHVASIEVCEEPHHFFKLTGNCGDFEGWSVVDSHGRAKHHPGYDIRNVPPPKKTVWLVGLRMSSSGAAGYVPFDAEDAAKEFARSTHFAVIDGPFKREIEVRE